MAEYVGKGSLWNSKQLLSKLEKNLIGICFFLLHPVYSTYSSLQALSRCYTFNIHLH